MSLDPSNPTGWERMHRRGVTRLLGAAVALWPLAARAQQPLPVIGFFHSGSPEQNVKRLAAFRKGLVAAGLVEGKNVTIDFHGPPARTHDCPSWRRILSPSASR